MFLLGEYCKRPLNASIFSKAERSSTPPFPIAAARCHKSDSCRYIFDRQHLNQENSIENIFEILSIGLRSSAQKFLLNSRSHSICTNTRECRKIAQGVVADVGFWIGWCSGGFAYVLLQGEPIIVIRFVDVIDFDENLITRFHS